MSHTLTHTKEIAAGKSLTAFIGVVFFVLATALGAYVRIPVPGSPVPITLQTFFVILSAAVLGLRLGLVSQISYIALGIFGVPVFHSGAMLGPTGGYIVGFAAAACVVGYLARLRSTSAAYAMAIFAAGSLVIYAFGAAWLVYLYGINIAGAVSVGILPFIPGDVAKILLAAIIYSGISRRAKALFSE